MCITHDEDVFFLKSHLGSHLLMTGLTFSPSTKHVPLTSELGCGYLLTSMVEADCPFTGFLVPIVLMGNNIVSLRKKKYK